MIRAAIHAILIALLAGLALAAQTGVPSAAHSESQSPAGQAASDTGAPLRTVPASDPRVQKLGMDLMCMCSCNQILIQCQHSGLNQCRVHDRMMAELERRVAGGESNDLILQDFVQEYGPAVLVVPPARGFDLTAWVMPIIVSIVGLGLAIVLVQRWRERSLQPATAQARPAAVRADLLEKARAESEEDKY